MQIISNQSQHALSFHHHNTLRTNKASACGLVLAAAMMVTTAANAQIVISEVLYDGPGADAPTAFIELAGPAFASLDGYTLVGINGNGGADYNVIDLTGNMTNGSGVFVVAHSNAEPALAAIADLLHNSADLQNGPDSLQLRDANGVVDALAYGVFNAGDVAGGEGNPAPDASPGQSLARNGVSSDTGDNAADFTLADVPTPGTIPAGGGGNASCGGVCGGASTDGSCYCDAFCFQNGDCCTDVCTECAVELATECTMTGCASDADCAAGETCDLANDVCVTTTIPGWTCDPANYGAADGCDCGCGIVDADCADATATCDDCSLPGACGTDCSTIDPTDNSQCINAGCSADADCGANEKCDVVTGACLDITGWTCEPSYFGTNDGCDCGCGIVDPDCADVTAASCEFCDDAGSCGTAGQTCPSNIEPTNNAVCIAAACIDDTDCATDETCELTSGQCVPALTGSCAGSCGGASANGTCFCDALCAQNGDCCADVCIDCAADVPDACMAPGCTLDADCGVGETCVAGVCLLPIATGYTVTVDSVDASNFPSIDMIVSVVDDSSGATVGTLDGSNFTVLEDGAPMENCSVQLISQGGGNPKTDIVFVFDSTGSMSDEIADLKQNILDFTDQLQSSGIDFNLGLVVYGDNVEGIFGMTQDADEFRSFVQAIQLGGGSNENPFDAIVAGAQLTLREDSERIFILATDEPATIVNTNLSQVVQVAQDADIRVHAAILPSLNAEYEPLVLGTGGSFFDLTGSFAAVLDDVVETIINRYAVTCDSPRPTRDNTTRRVETQVNDGGLGGAGSGDYFVEGGSLLVDPTYTVADIGSNFIVDIVATGVTDLQNAKIVLAFDPSYLTFVGASAGELLGRDDSQGTVQSPILLLDPGHDPANGRIAVAIARQSQEGTDGSGVLTQLEFTVTAAAPDDADAIETDDLVFVLGQGGVFLEDSANREIVVVDVQDGDIDTNGCGLLGDFDMDCDIDVVDFNTLVGAWGSTGANLLTDIGPASGLPPNMSPNGDGIVNFHDLFVFTRMYNWYREANP